MIRFFLSLVILAGGAFYFREDVSSTFTKGRAFVMEFSEKVKKMQLEKKYETLKKEVADLQEKIEEKAQEGGEKIEDIQKKLKAAQEAYEETQAALEKLNAAAKDIQELFETVGAEK